MARLCRVNRASKAKIVMLPIIVTWSQDKTKISSQGWKTLHSLMFPRRKLRFKNNCWSMKRIMKRSDKETKPYRDQMITYRTSTLRHCLWSISMVYLHLNIKIKMESYLHQTSRAVLLTREEELLMRSKRTIKRNQIKVTSQCPTRVVWPSKDQTSL